MPLETEKAQGQQQPLYTPPGPQPIIFEDFSGGLNTNSTRPGIKDNELWWSDGFFPIAPNYLRTIPDVGTAIYTAGDLNPVPPPAVISLWVTGSSCELMNWPLSPSPPTGNTAPTINIQGLTTTLTGPSGSDNSFSYATDIDASGKQYVLNVAQQLDSSWLYTIPIFAKGATGNIAPVAIISGSLTQLDATFGPTEMFFGGLCLDGSGNIYVGGRTTILKFPAGSNGNVASSVFVSDATFSGITSLFFDSARQWIWVSDDASPAHIRAYDLTATRQRNISGGLFSNQADQVYIGPDGSIFVAELPGNIYIDVFAPTADGAVSPTREIHYNVSANTAANAAIAVDQNGITYVGWLERETLIGHVVSFPADANGTYIQGDELTDLTGAGTLLDTMLDGAATYPAQLLIR